MSQTSVVVNGRSYPVPQQGLRIGRAPENDIVLPDPNVSRQHLVVWTTPRGAFLRDLGSQNGTFVNGKRVGAGPETVSNGSLIRVGITEMRVELIGTNGVGPVTAPTLGAGGYAGGTAGMPGGAGGIPGGGIPGRAAGPVPSVNPGSYAPARQSSSTGLIIAGIIGFVILAALGTGVLLYRAVSDSRASATPTATVRPVAAAATATPGSAPTAKPTNPTTPTAAPKPTEAPKPTTPPQPTEAPKPAIVPTQASGGRDPAFVRALNAAVRVMVPVNATTTILGSGSVITAKGHILTNYHVVSDENTGKLINNGQGIVIAVPPNEGDAAQPKYKAKVVQSDDKFDLAILQIESMYDGRPLPANLGLTPLPIGDSSKMQIGDSIIIIGFPSLGGSSLTATRGIDSGIARFSDDPGSFIKTDTEINHGNSGGMAINSAGELIGVPTAGKVDRQASGKIGLVRPINEAKALIDKVSR
jgi:S1-C subfamily serine protease